MYTTFNYPTKKAMKEAFKAWQEYQANPDLWLLKHLEDGTARTHADAPKAVRVFQPNDMFGANMDGRVSLEGPHYPKPHSWYADVEIKDGIVVKVYG